MSSKRHLLLDKKSQLVIKTAYSPKFVTDEIQIYLDQKTSKICLFKDSYNDVVLCDIFSVINKLSNSQTVLSSNINYYVKKYIAWFETKTESYDLYDHILFQHGNWVTWLFLDNDKARIIMTYIRPYQNKKFKCTRKKVFLIERSAFNTWCETLMSINF